MTKTRKTDLPRRTFLKGVGASMGLPLLEAMIPGVGSKAQALGRSNLPKRMAFVFVPNGVIPDAWNPKGQGADYELSPTLKPLETLKKDFIVFSGLQQDNARAKGDGGGDHARCASTFLTGVHPYKTAGADIRVGTSIDQLAASHVGNETVFPSLELGTEMGRNAGSCDTGYSCAYSSNISWKSPTLPMAKEVQPRLVFNRLFGATTKDEERRNFYRQSILDFVMEDSKKLKGKLGQTDRRKIDEYFTNVRELEQRIERATHRRKEAPTDLNVSTKAPSDRDQHIELMYDLMAAAFETDSTRVITFMLGNAGSNQSYTQLGVNEGHHSLSHHRNDEKKVADLKKIDLNFVQHFARFLEKLKSTSEGEGDLLDQSMIVFGSAIGDGNRHNHDKLPVLLAGRGGGTIDSGRHIAYDDSIPLNNLFLSMLDRVGAPRVKEFGDSTGRIKELTI